MQYSNPKNIRGCFVCLFVCDNIVLARNWACFNSLRGCTKQMKSLLKKLFWYFARNHLGLQFPALV